MFQGQAGLKLFLKMRNMLVVEISENGFNWKDVFQHVTEMGEASSHAGPGPSDSSLQGREQA